jgi:DGQHR domain-containing protein
MKNRAELEAFRAIPVEQPIGVFFLASIPARDLVEISSADLRHMEQELDRYVGIQRELKADRVAEIGKFVNSVDATFPTSVVLAVKSSCATFDEKRGTLTLHEGIDESSGEPIPLGKVANILDGQHRVEGLKALVEHETFDVPVSIFVDADIADQAYIFATVNLAQTKVNKSLVYDLLDYAKARSPQRSAHEIVVALDGAQKSPLYQKIKRLGTATPGRQPGVETLAQATVVNAILPLISRDPETDRFELAKGKKLSLKDVRYESTPLRHLWIKERDTDIARILFEYFAAVKEQWPEAWDSKERGAMLARTNGFRAFSKFFKLVYLRERPVADLENPIVSRSRYSKYFSRVKLESESFNSMYFLPGTSGETSLFNQLRRDTGV